MKDEELIGKVQESIAEVLDLEVNEVTLESKIMADLGAESIDLLDIASELEKIVNKEVDFSKMRSSSDADETDIIVGKLISFIKTL